MATTIIRALGYTGSLEQLVMPAGFAANVTAYLWGAGGGGGGCDSGVGGAGGGGGSSQVTFSVSPGDVIDVAVGGAGTGGASDQGSAPGGTGGASYVQNSTANYSGGNGSAAGPVPFSGGGGGGGGATVLFYNNTVIAVAGGGAGGGGGGNGSNGQAAPGARGQSGTFTSGQTGQTKSGDGGGAGGGGGGYDGSGGGGQGGSVQGGDQGGLAGVYGSSYGDLIAVPTGTTPGGTGWTYYPTTATVGYGGSGSSRAVYQSVPRNFNNWWYTGNWGWGWGYDQVLVSAAVPSTPGGPGYVVLEFTPQSLWCKDLGDWKPVQTLYVKDNNVWQPVKALYVKQNNVWTVVVADNGSAPNPVSQVGVNWGRSPRAYS